MHEPGAIDRQASEEAFRQAFPDAWAKAVAVDPPLASLVIEDGEIVNLDLGQGTLYPCAEPAWTRARLEQGRVDPERIGYSDPSHCNLSAVSMPLLERLVTYLRERAVKLEALPVTDVGYLFVFGIGLGRHIQELIRTTPARHVVLIEPVAEFIRHACAAVDWREVFASAEDRGIEIHVCVDADPEAICAFVETLVSREGNTFLDGSFFHPHYYSWTLKQASALMRERLKVHALSSGFFEDEVEMVRNCHGNLARWPFHLVESRPFREQRLPVFIVGAGPSLDADLPVIRRWREQVLLVSCGTTLGILLKHGLRPDIHVELERGALVYDLLAGLEKEHGFAGITLLASTTVDPRIGELFDKRWFFFRAGLAPAVLLRGSAGVLRGADPLCCNAAFAAIAGMGFSEIYFFGLDLAQNRVATTPRTRFISRTSTPTSTRCTASGSTAPFPATSAEASRRSGPSTRAGRCFPGSSGCTAGHSTTAAMAPGSTAPSRRPRPPCASPLAHRRGRWCCASSRPS